MVASIAGTAALAIVAVLCLAGVTTALLAWRTAPDPVVAQPSSPAATLPSPSPSPPAPATCLPGDWLETSNTASTTLDGLPVQLSGSGSVLRFARDGTITNVSNNVVLRGQAGGNSYEVIHNGTLMVNYQANDTTIYFSNPRATGTTSWKRNGRLQATEQMTAVLTPETYSCQDDQLRLYGDGYAIELTRLLPSPAPGRPA